MEFHQECLCLSQERLENTQSRLRECKEQLEQTTSRLEKLQNDLAEADRLRSDLESQNRQLVRQNNDHENLHNELSQQIIALKSELCEVGSKKANLSALKRDPSEQSGAIMLTDIGVTG